jgi:hypothetical protein
LGNEQRITDTTGNRQFSALSFRCKQAVSKSRRMISETKQIGSSVPRGAIEQDANHVEVPRIDRLIRKGIHRRTNGATRPGK